MRLPLKTVNREVNCRVRQLGEDMEGLQSTNYWNKKVSFSSPYYAQSYLRKSVSGQTVPGSAAVFGKGEHACAGATSCSCGVDPVSCEVDSVSCEVSSVSCDVDTVSCGCGV